MEDLAGNMGDIQHERLLILKRGISFVNQLKSISQELLLIFIEEVFSGCHIKHSDQRSVFQTPPLSSPYSLQLIVFIIYFASHLTTTAKLSLF